MFDKHSCGHSEIFSTILRNNYVERYIIRVLEQCKCELVSLILQSGLSIKCWGNNNLSLQ